MAILIFHSIQLACLYALNSMEASILIIFMDHQFVLSRTISSSHIFFTKYDWSFRRKQKNWIYKANDNICNKKLPDILVWKTNFLQGLRIVFVYFCICSLSWLLSFSLISLTFEKWHQFFSEHYCIVFSLKCPAHIRQEEVRVTVCTNAGKFFGCP